jgi:hypothetical protein
MTSKTCLFCNSEITGRTDKIYCDAHCKSSYQYQQIKNEKPKFYAKVDKQLKQNRKLLKLYNKAGKATVRSQTLLKMGFNPNFFTHYWKNKNGQVYLFVYEFGFLKTTEKQTEKYVLIKWQDYMNN